MRRVGRRRRTLAAVLPGVLVVAVLAGCSGSDAVPRSSIEWGPGSGAVDTGAVGGGAVDGGWRSTEVVDGDTLDVVGPLGELTVRIIGINTPEVGECYFERASDALAGLVNGVELRLVADRSDVDQFGRALRYVETADGADVGAELVAGGFAIARRYPPDEARADRYAELQREAQAAGRGLWAPDACGTGGESRTTDIAIDVTADAPGDDSVNLNGEFVTFTQTGAEPIELDGWEVADESASHRYTFDDLRLDPGSSVTLFSGCGTDDQTARYWCTSGSAVWNNDGDTVFLRDPSGNIVASLSYGASG